MFFNMIIKTLVLYFYIMLVYRIMGKKEVGKLSIIDLIVSILIAELAAIAIENHKDSIFVSIIPMTVLVVVQIILSIISLKNSGIRKILDGDPTVIINKGKLNFSEMTKLRYTLDDLTSQLREQGVKNIEEVDYAILENNGKLSVFQNTADYPLPIILDGVIDINALRDMNKTKKWVMNILKKEKIKLEDVFYAFYTKDKTFIIKKSDLL